LQLDLRVADHFNSRAFDQAPLGYKSALVPGARVGAEVDAPLLANMVPGGKSPMLTAERLSAYGFRIAIYPVAGLTAACAAMQEAYRYLLEHGSLIGSPQPAMPLPRLHELAGFPEVWAFEERHPEVE